MTNALTIDLEDWYHPELVRRHVEGVPTPQVEEATQPILDLLERHGVRATFFVLGDIARSHPGLIRRIHQRGHEIASHGMSHRPLWELDDEELGRELGDFRRVIEGILGEGFAVPGFRAPTFSMDNRTRYAMACLLAHGYAYDSSIFPVRNHVYGLAGGPCAAYRPSLDDLRAIDPESPIVEFPMTVVEWGGLRVPISGGFYLRALPYGLLKPMLARVNRTRPFVIYFHPWEIFPGTPRVPGLGLRDRFITYIGLKGAFSKVERLLGDFDFGRMVDVLRPAGEGILAERS